MSWFYKIFGIGKIEETDTGIKQLQETCEHKYEIIDYEDKGTVLIVRVCKKCGLSHTQRIKINTSRTSPIS